MNRLDETIGARTVWVHSFETRRVSRLISQPRPRKPFDCRSAAAVGVGAGLAAVDAMAIEASGRRPPLSFARRGLLALQGRERPERLELLGRAFQVPRE